MNDNLHSVRHDLHERVAAPSLLDQLASLARTALDDPDSLPDGEYQQTTWGGDRGNPKGYAIGKLDEIIQSLNPSTNDRQSFATTLTLLGRHLAERQDSMEALLADTEEPDTTAYRTAAAALADTLDALDDAILALGDGS